MIAATGSGRTMADLTIFYVADIHGSDVCFRKWLNAAGFYGADVLIIGGDLTGKVLLPIYPTTGPGEAWTATWKDRVHRLETRAEVDALIVLARDSGAYGYVTTADEIAEIGGSIEREREVFGRLKLAALEGWLALADERLTGRPDPRLPDARQRRPAGDRRAAREFAVADRCPGSGDRARPGMWMASRGESTPTPWHTPREVPDADARRARGDGRRDLRRRHHDLEPAHAAVRHRRGPGPQTG